MNNMTKIQRISHIIKELEDNGSVSVSALVRKLHVTKMTINRDLNELADKNIVTRVHGGAVLPGNSTLQELTRREKMSVLIDAKKQVGSKAASLVENGDIIFVGASTTNEFLIENIKDKHVRIITNSFYIFDTFRQNEEFEMVLLGGTLRDKSAAFIGEYANMIASHLEIDKCFIGANGIRDGQITNSNNDEASLQRIILERAKQKYILIDSSKFDIKDLYVFGETDQLNGIITDQFITPELLKKYSAYTNIIK